MSAASDLETLRDAASTALAAGDYATAKTCAERAKAILAMIPDDRRPSASLVWDRQAIDELIRHCDRQQAAAVSGGIQRSKVTWERVSTS